MDLAVGRSMPICYRPNQARSDKFSLSSFSDEKLEFFAPK